MRENLKKSIGYGIAAFVLSAYYFGVITSPDWHPFWSGLGQSLIIFNTREALKALLAGIVMLAAVTIGFKEMPALMEKVHVGVKMLTMAATFGNIFFAFWAGFAMFQIMDAPENILNYAFRTGAILSAIVALITLPFIYRFWRRHNRPLTLNDFNPFE